MSQSVLFIPVTGAIEWLYFPLDGPLVIRALLAEHHGEGAYVDFTLNVDGEESGRLAFLAPVKDSTVPTNIRAQRALLLLTDTHMVITGNACFVNIDPTLVAVIASEPYERTTP